MNSISLETSNNQDFPFSSRSQKRHSNQARKEMKSEQFNISLTSRTARSHSKPLQFSGYPIPGQKRAKNPIFSSSGSSKPQTLFPRGRFSKPAPKREI